MGGMDQQQLVLDDDPGRTSPAADSVAARRPATRHRDDLLAMLEKVTRLVREAQALGGPGAPGDAAARTRLRNTIGNAQRIAAGTRRVVEALPGADLELLRAHGRLLAATREAHQARTAADFADAARFPVDVAADTAPPELPRTGTPPGVAR